MDQDTLWEEDKPVEGVLLWAKFCWETLGPDVYVDVNLTHATYLNILVGKVYPFFAMVLPDGTGPFQQSLRCCLGLHIPQISFRSSI